MDAPPPDAFPRDLKNLQDLRRSPLQSHARTQEDLYHREVNPATPFPNRIKDYLKIRVVLWIYHYLKSRFGRRHAFKTYEATGDTGVYPLQANGTPGPSGEDDEIRVGLAGDWASGVQESFEVGQRMAARAPHYTIHLGDVYFVGTPRETEENFFTRVAWPLGSRGSFALNGNHEMYAKGVAYFRSLLPRLGLRGPDGAMQGQKASFFCLENDYWRVIGLDTGYNSVGLPIWEKIVKPHCKLPAPLLHWLRDRVKVPADNRGLVLLSHHQYYSAFEKGYPSTGRQLAAFIQRPVLWIWGHEHRMAIYEKASARGGIEAHGRCLGTGGMPVDVGVAPKKKGVKDRLLAFDDRTRRRTGGQDVGFNGFATLTFKKDRLEIDYRDLENHRLARETWQIDLATGRLRQEHFEVSPAITRPAS